jgi:hypothetical protein
MNSAKARDIILPGMIDVEHKTSSKINIIPYASGLLFVCKKNSKEFTFWVSNLELESIKTFSPIIQN